MRLSWNEIRPRAAEFAREWADAGYEKGETQSFYNAFFRIFGVERRSVARYEEHVKRLDDSQGFIDLFWPGVLLVEQKSAGRDLAAARTQAMSYFDALPEHERPRYLLMCDFQNFELLDLDEGEEARFPLAELPGNVEKFGFILGVQRRAFRDQDPVNAQAAELMARLHDRLRESGYGGHDLELFLVRTVFCLFADDTGIFEPRDQFLELLEQRTAADGSDLGGWLARLFQVLDTPEDARQATLDEDLARFPYVNGDLFAQTLPIPELDSGMRQALLDACRFDWTAISPAIFGTLFQSVMEPTEQRIKGSHYTSEANVLKVIEPLFLDDLRVEFELLRRSRGTRRNADLHAFRVPQAHHGNRAVDDGPHHEQPAQPRVRRGVRADPAHQLSPNRLRRRSGGRLGRRPAASGMRLRPRESAVWRLEVPVRGAAGTGQAHRERSEGHRHPRLRDRLVPKGRRVPAEGSPGLGEQVRRAHGGASQGADEDRLRGNELDYPR